jgi:signal transduction histidine kinase
MDEPDTPAGAADGSDGTDAVVKDRAAGGTIRSRLVILVLACVLPMWLVSALFAAYAYQSRRDLIERHMVENARAVMLTADRDLAAISSALQALATSPSLVDGDLVGFTLQAETVVHDRGGTVVVLADRTGRQLVNTLFPNQPPSVPRGGLDALRKVYRTGKPAITGLFSSPVLKRLVFGVETPVIHDGRVIYDLAMHTSVRRLTRLLAALHVRDGTDAGILDSDGRILARLPDPDGHVGHRAPEALLRRISRAPTGVIQLVTRAGVPETVAYSHSSVSGWTAVVGVPTATLTAEAWTWLFWSLATAVAAAALGLGLAMMIGRRVARSVRALIAPALALGRGDIVIPGHLDVAEVDEVGRALGRASDLLSHRRRQREVAERALAERTSLVQRHYENLRSLNDIAALPQSDVARQLVEALELGAHHLGLSIAVIAEVDGGRYIVRHHVAPPEIALRDGLEAHLKDTFCSVVVERNDVVAVDRVHETDLAKHPCYQLTQLECYIGAPITVRGALFGTVSFSAPTAYGRAFDDGDLEFMRLLARWIGSAIDRQLVHEELARSNAELEQFAYVTSHDLREPLRQVSSYMTLLERRYGDRLDEDGRDFIGFARDGARRMDALILDLLAYSRIGRQGQKRGPVDLAPVLAEARANLGVAIAEAGATVEIAKDMPIVKGNRDALVRLFQNLIGNAVKYRDPTRPPQVTVTARWDSGQWVVTVQDNGIGIAPEHYGRIFGIFQRLHAQGRYEGTGVGLAICKKIVEFHQGRIWVDSVPGQGSAFHVALPDSMIGDSIGREAPAHSDA